jgi:hypothetical protein
MTRRFPAPWRVEETDGGYRVTDATGFTLAYLYCRDDPQSARVAQTLERDEARRIAKGIARLPDLLNQGHAEPTPPLE